MKTDTKKVVQAKRDLVLETAKRERQAQDYMAVRSGARSAESMHLINREVAKSLKVTFEDVDFDEPL